MSLCPTVVTCQPGQQSNLLYYEIRMTVFFVVLGHYFSSVYIFRIWSGCHYLDLITMLVVTKQCVLLAGHCSWLRGSSGLVVRISSLLYLMNGIDPTKNLDSLRLLHENCSSLRNVFPFNWNTLKGVESGQYSRTVHGVVARFPGSTTPPRF